MLNKRHSSYIRGFVDPLSLIMVGFLVLTIAVGTAVTNNKNISLNINKYAKMLVDEGRSNTTATSTPNSTSSTCNVSLISTSGCGGGGCASTEVAQTWKTVTCGTKVVCNAIDDCKNATIGSYCSPDKLKTSVCQYGCNPNTSGGTCKDGPVDVKVAPTSTPKSTPVPTPFCYEQAAISCGQNGQHCVADLNGGHCVSNTVSISTSTPMATPTVTNKPTPKPTASCTGTCSGSAQGSISCAGVSQPAICKCDPSRNLDYPTWVNLPSCASNQTCVVAQGCSSSKCTGTCSGSAQGSISCAGVAQPAVCKCDPSRNLGYPTWVNQSSCTGSQSCVIGQGCVGSPATTTKEVTTKIIVTPTPQTCDGKPEGTKICNSAGGYNYCSSGKWYGMACPVNTVCSEGICSLPTGCDCVNNKYTGTGCGHSAGSFCIPEANICETTTCASRCGTAVTGNTGSCVAGDCVCSTPNPANKATSTPTTENTPSTNEIIQENLPGAIPETQSFYSQTDPEWQNYSIIVNYKNAQGQNVQVKRTMTQIGCGPTTVANILNEDGIDSTPTQIAQEIPSSSWSYGGTTYQSNIDILKSHGYEADPYTKSLYNLPKYMKPDEMLWVSANVEGIAHHTYIDGYTIENGKPVYTMRDPYFGTDLKCSVAGNEVFNCTNDDGQVLSYDVANNATIILTEPGN